MLKTFHSILHAINFHFHHRKNLMQFLRLFCALTWKHWALHEKLCAAKKYLNSKYFRLKKTVPEVKMEKNWCEKKFPVGEKTTRNMSKIMKTDKTPKIQWKFQIWISWKSILNNLKFQFFLVHALVERPLNLCWNHFWYYRIEEKFSLCSRCSNLNIKPYSLTTVTRQLRKLIALINRGN